MDDETGPSPDQERPLSEVLNLLCLSISGTMTLACAVFLIIEMVVQPGEAASRGPSQGPTFASAGR